MAWPLGRQFGRVCRCFRWSNESISWELLSKFRWRKVHPKWVWPVPRSIIHDVVESHESQLLTAQQSHSQSNIWWLPPDQSSLWVPVLQKYLPLTIRQVFWILTKSSYLFRYSNFEFLFSSIPSLISFWIKPFASLYENSSLRSLQTWHLYLSTHSNWQKN